MTAFDLPLDQLRAYHPERSEPADFDAFWATTLAESRALATAPAFAPTDARLRTVQVFDVTFSGYGGQPIRGWLLAPRDAAGPLPTVVEYIGYGGGRSFPFQWLAWSSAGYAHLVVDTRGQGSTWSPGDTPDIEDRPATGHYPGSRPRASTTRAPTTTDDSSPMARSPSMPSPGTPSSTPSGSW